MSLTTRDIDNAVSNASRLESEVRELADEIRGARDEIRDLKEELAEVKAALETLVNAVVEFCEAVEANDTDFNLAPLIASLRAKASEA